MKRTTPLLPGREIEEEEKRGKRRKINEGRENECSGGSGGPWTSETRSKHADF